MKLTHYKKEGVKEEKGIVSSEKRLGGSRSLLAAALVATLLPLSPMLESAAFAAPKPKVIQVDAKPIEGKKDPQPDAGTPVVQPDAAPAEKKEEKTAPVAEDAGKMVSQPKDFSGLISVKTSVLSLVNSERVMDQQISPTNMADLTVTVIDDKGVEFTLQMNDTGPSRPVLQAKFRAEYDGTQSGDVSILGPLGISKLKVAKADKGQATISFTYDVSAFAPPEKKADEAPASESVPIPAASGEVDYRDHALDDGFDRVDFTGTRRKIKLDNQWDIGGMVISNEAASSIAASIRFMRWLRLDGGNMWFGEQAAPFGTLSLKPELYLWRLKGVYYGRVSAVGNMPSTLYSSHALGLGYSQPLDKAEDWRLRIGIVGAVAFSYPAWDDIYANISVGASIQYKNWLLYSAPSFYWAAQTPMQTAYVGFYRPRFQTVESGIQMNLPDYGYTARIFADTGMLKQTYGVRVTRSVNFGDEFAGDVWVGTGVTHWIQDLGGRNDFVAMAGLSFVLGGKYVNSTVSARYEHMQNGGVPQAQTDIPTRANPGPYGFGRSGDQSWDSQVNEAKQRMLGASSFDGFAKSYAGASQDQVINIARFMGAFMAQVAYANGAESALNSAKIFDPEARRIAGVNNDTMMYYLQKYVNWYSTHSSSDQLPADLANGIAVCAGIHSLMADFMRANGVPTIVASVNTRNGPHVIAIAMLPSKTVLLDYGDSFTTPANSFDQTMRFYGQYRQAPTFQSQLFGPNGYMGTYTTPEGRLLHQTIGVYSPSILFKDFLGVH